MPVDAQPNKPTTIVWWRAHPSALLLVMQLVVVVLYPFLDTSTVGSAVIGVVSMTVVGLALWAVRRTPALNLIAMTLGVPALVFVVLESVQRDTEWIVLTSALLHAPFYIYVSYGLIRYLFHDTEVSRDEMFAIGAAFTVLAWGFAYLFVVVQIVWPGSFQGSGPGPYGWFSLLFLSFSNLTSVGLSDIVPVLDHARSVVIVEQVTGVLYVGMVVARLVGLTIMRAREKND